MIINNPNALRGWLTKVLQPICVADPAALARYVFALLKKDKPVKELKKIMTEQLNVFLGDETKPFLERLFSAIASEEYLSTNNQIKQEQQDLTTPTSTQAAPTTMTTFLLPTTTAMQNDIVASDGSACVGLQSVSEPEINSHIIKNIRELTPPLSDNKTKEIGAKLIDNNISNLPSIGNSITTAVVLPVSANQSVSPAKTASDKENHPRESRKRRASLRSRSRTRSRSRSGGERGGRRSRSRESRRLSEREKSSRQFRNKSPPLLAGERRRSDRRGGGSGVGSAANASGTVASDRSPRGFSKSNRTKSHSASRSRSISPERRKVSRSTSPSANELNDCPSMAKRQRCRDFDEKGYCVRGETCPWDHGINPVVLEGINNPALITMPPHLREYNPDAPELWNRSGTFVGPRTAGGGVGVGFPHNKPGAVPGVYPRPPPGIGGFRAAVASFPFPINPAATTPLQRELIPVPVVDANAGTGGDVSAIQPKRRYEPEDAVAIAEGPTKRKIPINSRLGPRVGGPQQNCSLELRKIPRGMNTIAHLNNHFSKFGKIVNIQVSYEGDPEAAIVTFSTHAEANVAYRSTEAVLNNRFIKVFWHSSGNNGETPMTQVKEDVIINGRKQSQYHLNNVIPAVPTTAAAEGAKTNVSTVQTTTATTNNATNSTSSTAAVTTTTTAVTAPTTVTSTVAHVQSPALRKNNRLPPAATNAIIRKKQEEQVKAVVQLAHGLHKRKGEILQEYLKQMKQAVELVERVEQTDPQRARLLETIKNLQGIIEKLKKEIAQEQTQIAAQMQNQQPPAKKSKEQQKKELLDIELELIAQQQEGNDTTAIQKRLEELQRSLGTISSHKSSFGGGGRPGGRLRTAPPGSTSVDRRPKTILITGFASEESDLILGHFKHFGEITKNEIDRNIPSLKISYATRSNAEQAILRGRVYRDKRLQIAWVTPTSLQNAAAAAVVAAAASLQQKQLSQQQQQLESNVISASNSNDDKLTAAISAAAAAPSASSSDITTTTATTPTSNNETSDNIPELHLEDEEEEEDAESEDRSWRR